MKNTGSILIVYGAGQAAVHRFPQLDFRAFGIHNPGKFAVFVTLHFTHHLNTFLLQCLQEFFQVMDAVVKHIGFVAGIKIFGIFFKGAPYSATGFLRVVELSPLEHAAVLIGLNTQVCFVPLFYFFRVFGFEKKRRRFL